jgi:hypothetical protein
MLFFEIHSDGNFSLSEDMSTGHPKNHQIKREGADHHLLLRQNPPENPKKHSNLLVPLNQ